MLFKNLSTTEKEQPIQNAETMKRNRSKSSIRKSDSTKTYKLPPSIKKKGNGKDKRKKEDPI